MPGTENFQMGGKKLSGKDKHQFIVSKEDWSLHRKGHDDQQRHKEKVKEAIRNSLPDLLTEESIILANGKEVIKIPIRSLEEYKIRYNEEKTKQVGKGDGDSRVGDIIARGDYGQKGGIGPGAGELPGEDYYETEISLEEIESEFFKELELPNMQKKEDPQLEVTDLEYNDIRKTGLMGNIDKKKTMFAAFRRNALSGNPSFYPIVQEDLRFKTWNEKVKRESKAVVLAMMDTSGSMGTWEKYMARSFFFWLTRFLRSKYESVEIVFIAHHTEAKVVSEEEFFAKGESGGTICSSAYRKALELIDEKYPPSRYNIYPFHISDGDNLSSDNARCVKLAGQIMDVANLFGYGEVNQYHRYSTLMTAYKHIKNEKFRYYIMKEKGDIYHALKTFFHINETAKTV
ncbi:sporulation protein YhbH [Caldibacillus debilis GB1]|jgi:sporulation protein YhbH|uniref:Sporulation protein YhbH n=2 Tax=Caldibacillus debilis TaxID=301148 RepID=A0A420VJM8_9BACI|nr:sporulation protein YhbH [Caldibacillus debilis GB1]